MYPVPYQELRISIGLSYYFPLNILLLERRHTVSFAVEIRTLDQYNDFRYQIYTDE